MVGNFSTARRRPFGVFEQRANRFPIVGIASRQSVTRIRADGMQNGIAQTSRRNEALKTLLLATPAFFTLLVRLLVGRCLRGFAVRGRIHRQMPFDCSR